MPARNEPATLRAHQRSSRFLRAMPHNPHSCPEGSAGPEMSAVPLPHHQLGSAPQLSSRSRHSSTSKRALSPEWLTFCPIFLKRVPGLPVVKGGDRPRLGLLRRFRRALLVQMLLEPTQKVFETRNQLATLPGPPRADGVSSWSCGPSPVWPSGAQSALKPGRCGRRVWNLAGRYDRAPKRGHLRRQVCRRRRNSIRKRTEDDGTDPAEVSRWMCVRIWVVDGDLAGCRFVAALRDAQAFEGLLVARV